MPWAPVSCPVTVSQLYWPPVLVTGTVPTTGPVTGLSRRSSIDAADVSALATWGEKLVTAPPKVTAPNLILWRAGGGLDRRRRCVGVGHLGGEAGDSAAEVDAAELDPLARRGGLDRGAAGLGLRRQCYPAVVVEVLRLGGMADQVLGRDGQIGRASCRERAEISR